MSCIECANIFSPSDKALQLMQTFGNRQRDDVRQFLADYERVCNFLATVELDDNEVGEEQARVSEVAPPWDEAGEGKMLE